MNANVNKAALELASLSMHGDLVKVVIDEMKAAPRVWQELSENQQGDLIARVQDRCREVIQDAVSLIAAEGRVTIVAELESVAIKDGIKAVCTLPKSSEQRHDLYDAQGKQVLIVVASAEAFLGGEMPRADPDQKGLNGFE